MYVYYNICILNTLQNNALKSKAKPAPPPFSAAQLLRFFIQLLPRRALYQLPALQTKDFYHRLFTPLVTLWYLLFQRLNPDHSLEAALSDARAGGGDWLNKKLSPQLTSDSTASWSDARQRLPEEFLAQALALPGRQISGLSPTTLWQSWRLALLDGSTVRLRPHGRMAKHFPPARNQ